MRISVIGTGAIGGTLARGLAAAGHDVLAANSRGPAAVPAEVLDTGAQAASLADAVRNRDAVIVSVPFHRVPDLRDLFAGVADETVVIDTANYYPHLNGHIEAVEHGQVESQWVAEQLGRPVAKAWNAVLAGTLQAKALKPGTPGRIAVPVAADSDRARRTAMQLVDDSGFDSVDAGAIVDSWRQQPGTPAYCTELTTETLTSALAAADRSEAPRTRDRLIEHFSALTSMPSLEAVVETNRSAHH
ncbi:NADPH-dependent F420 reductase [Glycomyces algeriensis]|uniref:3-hydroxyisobutyrate dehydrogenase n=1 Tax=Glycomyces algeriensis TaxID=256037 RepID=A0A9W6GA11_9ACTN|nr:NAD(P)-binding domain-containing protein [Glycomyces algeriensis]MDA1365686.1 NAD(P)-binding domain-containing protein [Glycomyces algeriensis]MDR7351374.1 putative dinucleotide-binding enzyme [Glycomyces algeriensis]GLI44090.1 3-hydroxyisobutyrate dehydrogenase [Glycomyces algeriensis]